MNNIYAALEIGTTRTVLAIGESEAGRRLKVTCHAEIPSTGIRKSQILDINQATQSIRSVLQQIERQQDESGSKITIGNAFERNGSTVIVSPSVNMRMWSWQVVQP